MPDTTTYRGNKLEVKKAGRKNQLSINEQNIASFTNDELKQGMTTQYSYLPANDLMSYCQIWCTAGCSCGGSAVFDDLNAVVELDALDDLCELSKAA